MQKKYPATHRLHPLALRLEPKTIQRLTQIGDRMHVGPSVIGRLLIEQRLEELGFDIEAALGILALQVSNTNGEEVPMDDLSLTSSGHG